MLTQTLITPSKPMSLNDLYQAELENKALKGDRKLTPKDFSFGVEHDNGKPIYQLNHKASNRSYRLTESCISNLCNKFGYTKRLITNLTEDVVTSSINQLLDKFGNQRHLFRFIKTPEGNAIRAILSDSYAKFDNFDLLNTILEVLGKSQDINEWEIVKGFIDEEIFEIRLARTLPKEMRKLGEPSKLALNFSNSEVGLRSVEGALMLFILKCTNGFMGLNSSDSFKVRHIGNNQNRPEENLRKMLENANDSWTGIMDNYNDSENILIAEPLKFIETVSVDYSLGKKVSEYILENYQATSMFPEMEGSLKSISDSFTEIAHTKYNMKDDNYRTLELIGSKVLKDYPKYINLN